MNRIGNNPDFIRLLFEVSLPVFMPQGLTFIAPDHSGVATWMGPNSKLKWPFKPSNFFKALKMGGLRCLYRFAVSGLLPEKYHPKEPHYYLFAIGTLPEFRRKGTGTALISPTLRKCDQQRVPAYLENSSEAKPPFYLGNGFKMLEKIPLPMTFPRCGLCGGQVPAPGLDLRQPAKKYDCFPLVASRVGYRFATQACPLAR